MILSKIWIRLEIENEIKKYKKILKKIIKIIFIFYLF